MTSIRSTRGMIAQLMANWRSPSIGDANDLREFLGQRAAFISQKCTIEYCRARSGLLWVQLFSEPDFQAALEISRWEAFAAVLIDCAVLIENKLRPGVEQRSHGTLAEALGDLIDDRLAYHPTPAHRPEGWDEVAATARLRLHQCQLAAPKPAHEIGWTAGQRVYDTLPMHPNVRGYDLELVRNNVRLNLARVAADFEAYGRPAPIVEDLLRGRGAGAGTA